MTPFSFTPTPANKSPTSTVTGHGMGNGQPGGQLDVGASLSDGLPGCAANGDTE